MTDTDPHDDQDPTVYSTDAFSSYRITQPVTFPSYSVGNPPPPTTVSIYIEATGEEIVIPIDVLRALPTLLERIETLERRVADLENQLTPGK